MAIESPVAKQQFFDANGNPLVGGKLYIYEAGTTTPATTWTDKLQTAANANPIILDSRGECVIWLDTESAYKYVLKTAIDVEVYSVDNVNGALAIDNLRTDLAADAGSSLIGYIAEGTGAVATTVQDKLRESVSVKDFGAVGDGVTDDTDAIQAAIDAAEAQGGGIVIIPTGVFRVSELVVDNRNVIIQGSSSGIGYGNEKSTSVLQCNTGVYAIRFKVGSAYACVRDLVIRSNGLVNTVSPYIVATPGVEYGVIFDAGSTLFERVLVTGFQYGVTIVNAGNSNVFRDCTFSWNTRVGFAITSSGATAFAMYHPNLDPPEYLGSPYYVASTVVTLTDCNMRRNGWGIILRGGSLRCDNVLTESNIFGGLLVWAGTNDATTVGGGNWDRYYTEANWQSFDPAAITWATSALTGNNYTLDTVGNHISLADDSDNAVSEFGYQIIFGSSRPGTVFGGAYAVFNQVSGVLGGSYGKFLYIKGGYNNTFNNASYVGGDQTNAVRLGNGSYLATYTQINNPNGTLPSDWSNRGFSINPSGAADGGLTMTGGYFRGLDGIVTRFGTPAPTTITTASYNADIKDTSLIANYAGAVTIALRPASETGVHPQEGRWIYIKTVTANAVVSSTSNIVPINGTAAGTAILPATAGAWAALQSDGTNWVIMSRGT